MVAKQYVTKHLFWLKLPFSRGGGHNHELNFQLRILIHLQPILAKLSCEWHLLIFQRCFHFCLLLFLLSLLP